MIDRLRSILLPVPSNDGTFKLAMALIRKCSPLPPE